LRASIRIAIFGERGGFAPCFSGGQGKEMSMRDYAERVTWVAVADGEKALLFRNDDTDSRPFLNVIRKDEIDNPPTREQGADRPGRYRGGSQPRSAFDDADWHQLGKERFAREFAGTLNAAALKDAFDQLVIFAPPGTLGQLRGEYHPELQKRLVKEVGSDLTNHPVGEIEKQLAKALRV
jgi:protein required for attachment to host cells